MDLCRCGHWRTEGVAGRNSSQPGREYYRCQACGKFDWKSSTTATLHVADAGPACKCGTASVKRTVTKPGHPNLGKRFWCCAVGGYKNGGCGFFLLLDDEDQPTSPPKQPRDQRKPRPGFVSYVSDWHVQQEIQKLMTTNPKELGRGRDFKDGGEDYDTLEVVGAWKIKNEERKRCYQKVRERMAKKLEEPPESVVSAGDFAEAAATLARASGDPLQPEAGEHMLLHGTKPSVLEKILFEGLDPSICQDGLFGRGTYFAEDAGKIDQYAEVDSEYSQVGPLAGLHEGIYKLPTQHPKEVRYGLVCRVVCGKSVHTADGSTSLRMSGGAPTKKQKSRRKEDLFANDKRDCLAAVHGQQPDSLVAELGGIIKRYREFVVFNGGQILVEYLVAYKRERRLCDCREPAASKTVTDNSKGNAGRQIFFCPRDLSDQHRCKFIRMLPVCSCGRSAVVKTVGQGKNKNRLYFSCGSGRHGCGESFMRWATEVEEFRRHL